MKLTKKKTIEIDIPQDEFCNEPNKVCQLLRKEKDKAYCIFFQTYLKFNNNKTYWKCSECLKQTVDNTRYIIHNLMNECLEAFIFNPTDYKPLFKKIQQYKHHTEYNKALEHFNENIQADIDYLRKDTAEKRVDIDNLNNEVTDNYKMINKYQELLEKLRIN